MATENNNEVRVTIEFYSKLYDSSGKEQITQVYKAVNSDTFYVIIDEVTQDLWGAPMFYSVQVGQVIEDTGASIYWAHFKGTPRHYSSAAIQLADAQKILENLEQSRSESLADEAQKLRKAIVKFQADIIDNKCDKQVNEKFCETMEEIKMENNVKQNNIITPVTVAVIEEISERASAITKAYDVSRREALRAATLVTGEEIQRDLTPLINVIANY